MKNLSKTAKKILKTNRRKGYTLPTNNKLYPAQWNWDSAFISIGYSYFNLEYAIKELLTLIKGQWKNRMIPHILFHEKDDSYFPNHKTWKCGNSVSSSGITQPPIVATALKLIITRNKLNKNQKKRVILLIKKLKKYHDWFYKYRDPKNTGLVSIIHPWESGLDNSPLWDSSLKKIKIDKKLSYKRRDLEVSNSKARPLNRDYDCYITLLNQFKKLNYNPNKLYSNSMFNVVDIGFNSIFLKASKDLLEIAKLYNLNFKDLNKKIFKTESSLLKMYNKKKNIFYSYDLKNKFFINIPSISNYFILFADLNNKKVNKKIIESLKKYNQKEKYIFSSIKPDHKSFEEKRYWRGPVWINTNWIIYQSLKNKDKVYAKKIKDKTIKLIEEKNFFEYYSCKNAETLGANNFSWSSALYLDLIYESN